ncbi:MAG: Hpt domain-containing protein, partial [Proteobacteria bacterium]|nr:Hpt domain-containing protein [Pseudomonadota bacterium]
RTAALRLQSLAASFHASELMALAEEAAAGAPGDPAIVRRISALLADWPA